MIISQVLFGFRYYAASWKTNIQIGWEWIWDTSNTAPEWTRLDTARSPRDRHEACQDPGSPHSGERPETTDGVRKRAASRIPHPARRTAVLLSVSQVCAGGCGRSGRREQPVRPRRWCPSSRRTPRPCWSLDCKPVWLLAKLPREHKREEATRPEQRPWTGNVLLASCPHPIPVRVTDPPSTWRKQTLPIANSKTQWQFSHHHQNQF